MTIYRSYFSKNNTLISGNKTNNGKNPVCEISYGTADKELSRFLFDIDLSLLKNKINTGIINSGSIVSHTLNMTNTIRFAEEYVGKKSYTASIHRASNFTLDLFQVNQEWDEGTSYDFIYGVNYLKNSIEQESNWVNRKLNTPWDCAGAYSAGTNTIINSQYFRSGSENISIDVTNLINNRLISNTSSNGLGIKFQDIYENTATNLREAVGFHTKYTNTVYEPYIETVIDDIITDDRNFFFLDKENNLYLYSPEDVIINNVTIYDYEDNVYCMISGASVVNISKGVNKISLTIDSDTYPDAVIFRDVWNVIINGKTKSISNMFYLISQDNYFNFNNQINFDNYFFSFQGIKEREKISSNHIRKIKVLVKEMYPNQNNFIPLDIEYRIFTTVASKYEIDYIPFTKVNRTNYGYEFNLDTSWLIPQDYKIQIRLKNGYYFENKEILNFKVVSEGINIFNYVVPTTTVYTPTTTEYIPTTTVYTPTTTVYTPTTTEYIPTTLPIYAVNVTLLTVDDLPTLGNVGLVGEQDWFVFRTSTDSEYVISTSGTTDLAMKLYTNNLDSLIAYNDDSSMSNQPLISQFLSGNSLYYIQLYYFNNTNIGEYNISVIKKSFENSTGLTLTFDNISGASSLISGDTLNVNLWNNFFDLPNYGNKFTKVYVKDNTIKLVGGSNITLKPSLFQNNQNILSVIDETNTVVNLEEGCFNNTLLIGLSLPFAISAATYSFMDCYFLDNIYLPSLTSAGNACFMNCFALTSTTLTNLTSAGISCFNNCNNLTIIDLQNLIRADYDCFGYCGRATSALLPKLSTIGDNCFRYCNALANIDLSTCTALGTTVGDNNVFNGINNNTITLTIPTPFMTCNNGSPDGDIQYLQANNIVNIVPTTIN